MIDPAVLQIVLMELTDWLDRRETHAVGCLMKENRMPAASAGWPSAAASHGATTVGWAEHVEHYQAEWNH